MKIIIVGAGQVGSSLSINLVKEGNDVTLIDKSADLLENIAEKVDLQTIHGNGAHPRILEAAGANKADMIVAVSKSDETNMIACQVAYTVFGVEKKIARIRDLEYLNYENLFADESTPIDFTISPDLIASSYIKKLIKYQGTRQVFNFSNDNDCFINIVFKEKNNEENSIMYFQESCEKFNAKICAFIRKDKLYSIEDGDIIENNDELLLICKEENIEDIMKLFGRNKNNKRIMIAGGGNIGRHLSENISEDYQVKVIESNEERAEFLSEIIDDVTIINADSSNEDILLEENIEHMDVFCALTNDDEANILSAMLAKKLGSKTVLSIINKISYSDLVENQEIDITVSPEDLTMGALLTHIRKGSIVKAHSLMRGNLELLELELRDKEDSKIIGKNIEQINISENVIICCIIRDENFIFDISNLLLEKNDRLVCLVNKKDVKQIEELFE
ncbi:MAG: Trk system potassium transporter TrkA [Pseudomonadota bacterium]|jgi:trk system potassium uptake protein TrkA|nr:Trk system potassium transporter TrkA [Pseudomonadota bacterium]|tara:strand:+ start:208 stop:1551 length:1344 start_codon:yes stop_codon:yes gene_type:complete